MKCVPSGTQIVNREGIRRAGQHRHLCRSSHRGASRHDEHARQAGALRVRGLSPNFPPVAMLPIVWRTALAPEDGSWPKARPAFERYPDRTVRCRNAGAWRGRFGARGWSRKSPVPQLDGLQKRHRTSPDAAQPLRPAGTPDERQASTPRPEGRGRCAPSVVHLALWRPAPAVRRLGRFGTQAGARRFRRGSTTATVRPSRAAAARAVSAENGAG